MTEAYHEFGERLEGEAATALGIERARATHTAILEHRDFTWVEARRRFAEPARYSEILVVDVSNDRIPTKNPAGILYQERLALRFFDDRAAVPQVRALRIDFPATDHQNLVCAGKPASLCLYFEPWPTVARTWTAQKHLARILWWLEQTALGRLHRADQPLEALYFDSPIELVLPWDFHEKLAYGGYGIELEKRADRGQRFTLVGRMVRGESSPSAFSCIAETLPPVVHGQIERFPFNLGELEDTLVRRGASLITALLEKLKARFEGGVRAQHREERTVLLLTIPLVREHGGPVERQTVKGYVLGMGLADIGLRAGVLDEMDGLVIIRRMLGRENRPSSAWREVSVAPVEIHEAFTPAVARRVSGIIDSGPRVVLAGAGALGSALLEILRRSGWGEWTVIDPDHIKPHNLARHVALAREVGVYKTDAVRTLDAMLWNGSAPAMQGVAEKAEAFHLAPVFDALTAAQIVVDATTTLEYPRDHAANDSVPRGISVFLTPRGEGAVLLSEDEQRRTRLDVLETQYYRMILSRPWGRDHLPGNQGTFWSGAGCRDLSTVISPECISVHAGILARQLQGLTGSGDAAIRVWHYDPKTGAVEADTVAVEDAIEVDLAGLKIVWDAGIRERVRVWRARALPAETGGVLLGYFDLTAGKAYIVDALPPPPDSRADPTGFTRGVEGLGRAVAEAQRRTANIVGYVGEWHSHPIKIAARPSIDDVFLLVHLGIALHRDGLPALMLIVGEGDEGWYSAKGRS